MEYVRNSPNEKTDHLGCIQKIKFKTKLCPYSELQKILCATLLY